MAQYPDGSWNARGSDGDRRLIDHINTMGVALELECFSINTSDGAKMVWIEPVPTEES